MPLVLCVGRYTTSRRSPDRGDPDSRSQLVPMFKNTAKTAILLALVIGSAGYTWAQVGTDPGRIGFLMMVGVIGGLHGDMAGFVASHGFTPFLMACLIGFPAIAALLRRQVRTDAAARPRRE